MSRFDVVIASHVLPTATPRTTIGHDRHTGEQTMPLKKIYDFNETAAAIERADGKNINKYKLVRNDVSNADFNRKKIPTDKRNPDVPAEFQYPGKRDEGHVFRHVEGTHAPGKSTYLDRNTAICVTMQLLNSAAGQKALGELDAQKLDLYDNQTKRVTANVTGNFRGKASETGPDKQIERATCELMKLGEALWVHSSYPRAFKS